MSEDIQEAFNKTRIAGTIASGALDEVTKIIKPGIKQINKHYLYYKNEKAKKEDFKHVIVSKIKLKN